MDPLFVISTLTALNNRVTEAFKMVLRDKTPLDDEWRRFFTLVFSVVIGIGSFAIVVLGTNVSFENTQVGELANNQWGLIILGGFSVSTLSGLYQVIIDNVRKPSAPPEPEPAS